MKHLLIILSFLLLSSPLFGQSSERPETIIIPVSSMGDVSDIRKQILQNTLEGELKGYFRLVPQEKYEEVLEKVFEELDYQECSEDVCILRVQEMLQVENVFHLQVIGEGQDTQLSLSWRTLDEKRKEEEFCEGCGTGELRKMIGGLVEKLVGGKKVEPVVVVEKKEMKVLSFSNGDYIGEVKNGKPNVQGTYTFHNGNKYEGEWRDGKYHGQGIYTFHDGRKYVGEWNENKEWNGTRYDKYGNILWKTSNGKRINQ